MTQMLILTGAAIGGVVRPALVLVAASLAAVGDILFSGRW